MSGPDRAAGDDRTFRVNFSGDGATSLRETVKEKLKEYMGDYTDDTLAEYVVVLLRNGRRKEEARKELNVFLGDDSVSFVSWLWDHLSSNLHLYVQLKESFQPEGDKTRLIHTQPEHGSDNFQPDSESEREKPEKVTRSRRKREWKGLVQDVIEPPLLRSCLIENSQTEKKTLHKRSPIRRSRSPRPWINKKRGRLDEPLPAKREVASHSMLDAPRRLLQFAVRDAVRTVQQSTLRSEPALKRLRSVVSTSTVDSALDGLSLKPKSVARVPSAVATAIKAAAEAAEDVVKVKSSANVFDRLGNGMDGANISTQSSDYRAPMLEDGECEDFDQIQGLKGADYYQRSGHDREFAGDMTVLDGDTGMATDFISDNEGYDSVGLSRLRGIDAPQRASSAVKDKESLMVQYSVDQNADVASRKMRTKDQDPRITTAANTSGKILNISVNVNTWKPHHYQSSRGAMEAENRLAVEKSEPSAGKPSIRLPMEKNSSLSENQNEAIGSGAQKDNQKTVASTPGSYSTGRPAEDADSRTVFVNNVHYAATKDTLSRHFNKFGEVLKVVIVTDAATGQPKGSAYVEFLRKESAELALSLNGTSFMSRILKVVRRSSAHHEAAPMMSWPRGIARGSPFASRLGRVPYSRAMMPSAFRARLPMKVGARSLQWKRDGPSTPTVKGTKSLQNTPLSGQRHLTYIRTGPKPGASSDPV